MIAEDRARLLDLQRARLAQVQGQIAAIERAAFAMRETRRERIAPHTGRDTAIARRALAREARALAKARPLDERKPSAQDIERANAYLRRLGVPEGLL